MKTAIAAALCVLACAGCEREARRFHEPPPAAVPGGAAGPVRHHPYAENAYAIAQGKQLFVWYNCVGCHARGGGGMGPALTDAQWLYGAEPGAIYASIAGGRPNGMPAFGSRIPEQQVWQLVAYVRSMAGFVRSDAAPGRADSLHASPPELTRDTRGPVPKQPGS